MVNRENIPASTYEHCSPKYTSIAIKYSHHFGSGEIFHLHSSNLISSLWRPFLWIHSNNNIRCGLVLREEMHHCCWGEKKETTIPSSEQPWPCFWYILCISSCISHITVNYSNKVISKLKFESDVLCRCR